MKDNVFKTGLVMLLSTFLCLGFVSKVSAWNYGVGTNAGTLGIGINFNKQITSKFSVRLTYDYFSYDYDSKEDQIDYDFDLTLNNGAGLIDWYPFAGHFRISTGLFINGNDIDADAKGQGTYEIGDKVYTASEIGKLKGELDFNSIAPYLGIGWTSSHQKKRGWFASFDIGVVFQGSPDVDLKVNGPIASDPEFQANLRKEENNLEDEVDEYKYYPVVMLGISYVF